MEQNLLSGIRPTGPLHLGHYFGILKNWIRLQDEFKCYFMIADCHALTTFKDPAHIEEYSFDLAANLISLGIDPENATIFRQSDISAHSEAYLLFGMFTPLSWLERNPTFKEMAQQNRSDINLGLLGYPVLQTVDIVLYNGQKVPVGKDQIPHLELAREIVRKINKELGLDLIEPEPLLSKQISVLGLDGINKMSNKLRNFIGIADSPEVLKKNLRRVVTDTGDIPDRKEKIPTVKNLFNLLRLFSEKKIIEKFESDYRSGTISYKELKDTLCESISSHFADFRLKREEFYSNPERIRQILEDGRNKASKIADATLRKIKKKLRFS